VKTSCTHCGSDPCQGTHIQCDLTRFYVGNITCPVHLGISEPAYQVIRCNFLGAVAGPNYSDPYITFDPVTNRWSLKPQGQVCEQAAETIRKCECGVWATGGLHSDWCPCAGGDCVQKEDR
jgi:hypothetical protein